MHFFFCKHQAEKDTTSQSICEKISDWQLKELLTEFTLLTKHQEIILPDLLSDVSSDLIGTLTQHVLQSALLLSSSLLAKKNADMAQTLSTCYVTEKKSFFKMISTVFAVLYKS